MLGLNGGLVGVGLYTVPEASRLSGVSTGRIRRWLRGYVHRHGDEKHYSAPVWESSVPVLDGALGVSFLDLMEVRFVDAFCEAGVPWRVIRLAAERARNLYGGTHPFSTHRFSTDGRTIFAEALQKSRDAALLDLVKSQYAFHRVISPSLYSGFDFGNENIVQRWWPLGKGRRVVLDPARAFGQPIVADAGIPTAVLAHAVEVEGSSRSAAAWFQVEIASVRDALAFERRLVA